MFVYILKKYSGVPKQSNLLLIYFGGVIVNYSGVIRNDL